MQAPQAQTPYQMSKFRCSASRSALFPSCCLLPPASSQNEHDALVVVVAVCMLPNLHHNSCIQCSIPVLCNSRILRGFDRTCGWARRLGKRESITAYSPTGVRASRLGYVTVQCAAIQQPFTLSLLVIVALGGRLERCRLIAKLIPSAQDFSVC